MQVKLKVHKSTNVKWLCTFNSFICHEFTRKKVQIIVDNLERCLDLPLDLNDSDLSDGITVEYL